MAEMQNYKKRKRKTSIEILEKAEHFIKKAINMKIEITSVKGQMEETFLRFPHIGEQILEHLDIYSLFKCHHVSKPWSDFVGWQTKPLPIELLHKVAKIPKAKLKKSLKKTSVKTIRWLVVCAINERKKICFNKRNLQAKLIYHMVIQKHLNKIQILLIELILQNVKHMKIFITHYNKLLLDADLPPPIAHVRIERANTHLSQIFKSQLYNEMAQRLSILQKSEFLKVIILIFSVNKTRLKQIECKIAREAASKT